MMPAPFRPETSALVLIDHQVGTMQLIKTLALADVKRFPGARQGGEDPRHARGPDLLVYPTISAVDAVYQVQAVLDISGSPFALSEETSRKRMELAGVQFTATNTIIAELAQDWSTPHGGELIRLLFTDVLPEVVPVTDGQAAAA